MPLVRHPKKLVRPGQWVLARICPYLREHSYTFEMVEKAYLCVVPMLTPNFASKSWFDWRYRVYWRYWRGHGPDEKPCYSHDQEHKRKEKDPGWAYQDGQYYPLNTY